MIKQIQNFLDWTRAAMVAAIVVTIPLVLRLIENITAPKPILHILLFVLVVLIFRVLELLTKALLEQSIWVRRLILKQHFIEGFWIDKVLSIPWVL